ncbi:uncharacterized protein LOC143921931 [Arctopsyche grandis]|uniref:uncharacterized protein LOC143921931 n=1 Tax=Arctopsyche grandis TaxID=121162 RepID=UPI00406D67F1
MVNNIQNVETRSQSIASGRDAAQSTTTRKIETENEEGTSSVGRLLRARRHRPLSTENTTNNSQINSYFPVLQCKLPLDRIEDILSKIKKTELSNIDKSDNVRSDLSVQTELNPISNDSDLLSNISGDANEVVEKNKNTLNAPIRIMCLFCDRTFVSDILLQKHTERSHHISSNRRFSSRNIEQTASVNFHPGCNFCSKNSTIQTAANLSALFNHLLDEHAIKYFACRKCEIRFSTKEILISHNRDEHGIVMNDVEISASEPRSNDAGENGDVVATKSTRSSSLPLLSQFTPSSHSVSSKNKSAEPYCLLQNQNELGNSVQAQLVDFKSEKRNKNPNRRSKTQLNFYSDQSKIANQSSSNDFKLPLDRPKVNNSDFVDFEDNAAANLILSQRRPTAEPSTSNKKMNIEQNAVIILDDINFDNKLFKNKQNNPSPQTSVKPDEKDNQILSRLGIAQNRTSRARSLRRSRKTPLTENRACSETPRRDKTKAKNDNNDFVINKSKNDPNSKFDPDFYSNVSLNVRENLTKHLDGKLGRQNDSVLVHDLVDPKIKSTHAVIQSPSTQPAEIHGSDVNLNAITIFPTLLTSDQYGSDRVPHYSYGANAQTFKKIITKNSWKWKWDPIKKYKYCNEDGKVVRKIRPVQQISPRDLSKLDIWTQLTMREKHEQSICNSQSSPNSNNERANRCERQKQINELNMILDKRSFPDIESENGRFVSLADECENTESLSQSTSINKIFNSVDEEKPSTSTSTRNEDTSENTNSSERDTTILQSLGLVRNPPKDTKTSSSVLSGEWARPRCYICCICGRRADCLRLLEAHQASHHPQVNGTYYEIVGQELLDDEVYNYLYLPGAKSNQEKTQKNESLRNIKKIPHNTVHMHRSSRILRTTTRSIKSLEKRCTKCKKMLAPNEFYRHILECAGDYGWTMVKKKCKYKPFGARRRRLKGLYKREVPQEEDRTETKGQNVRPKLPPRPRTKPSDAETIQRMLANLPPKRASRQIHDLSSPKPKSNSQSERKQQTSQQIHNSKSNLKLNKIMNGSLITAVKTSLGKKVRRLTRSVSSMYFPDLEDSNVEDSTNSVSTVENSDKELLNEAVEEISQEKDLTFSSDNELDIKDKTSEEAVEHENTDSNNTECLTNNVASVKTDEKVQRSRGGILKNDAINEDIDPEETIMNISQKSLRRKTVVSSKIINMPLRRVPKIKKILQSDNVQDKPDNDMSTDISEPDAEVKNSLLPKNKKNKKKVLGFPLKWIGNKKVHFAKSKKSLKKKNKIDEIFTDDDSKKLQENLASQDETKTTTHEKDSSTNDANDIQKNILSENNHPLVKTCVTSGATDSTAVEYSKVSTDEDENLSKPNTSIPEMNITDVACESTIVASNISIVKCSNFKCTDGNFSNSNSNICNKESDKSNIQLPSGIDYKNKPGKIFNNDVVLRNAKSEDFSLGNVLYNKTLAKNVDETVNEPIRSSDNAYCVRSANIDKPPLTYDMFQLYTSIKQSQANSYINIGQNVPNLEVPISSDQTIDHANTECSTSKTPIKNKQPKSKRGLNDCIAMLKGKLVEKTNIFTEAPRSTSVIYKSVYNNNNDVQQPLDLSGRIPQPEDLSMKTANSAARIPAALPTPVASKTITPPKPVAKPIYDPILKIPQYQLSSANQPTTRPVNVDLKNVRTEVVKKNTSDFSIPSLLSPDKKIPRNLEMQVRTEIAAIPKTLANSIEKLSVHQREEIVNALPKALAKAVEIQLLKNSITANTTPQHTKAPDGKQMKQHFIEDILSTGKSFTKNTDNPKICENKKEVSQEKVNIETTPAKITHLTHDNVKILKQHSEFHDVNTDLFLIDPVTGIITERNSNKKEICDKIKKLIEAPEKLQAPVISNISNIIIDLTKGVEDHTEEPPSVIAIEKPLETAAVTHANNEDSLLNTSKDSTASVFEEQESTSFKSVYATSVSDKLNQNITDNTYEDSLKVNDEQESSNILESQPFSEHIVLNGVYVESTTSSIKESDLNSPINDCPETVVQAPIEHSLEPAIQQDEVSSTQHSVIDDSSNSFPLESVCSKENEITNSENILTKLNERVKVEMSVKPPPKGKRLKNQLTNNFSLSVNKEVVEKGSQLNTIKKWSKRKSNKTIPNAKKESLQILEEPTTKINHEISSSNKQKSKQKNTDTKSQTKSNIDNSEDLKTEDKKLNNEIQDLTALGKFPIFPASNIPFDYSEKIVINEPENVQQLSLNLIDQNIISEFALTPTNVSELKTDDDTEIMEDTNVLIPTKDSFQEDDLILNDQNKIKTKLRAIDKKLPQKNIIEAYTNAESIESSILTGEVGKTNHSQYPIARSDCIQIEEIARDCIAPINNTILSANEESDDDICLAEMAKKRLKNSKPTCGQQTIENPPEDVQSIPPTVIELKHDMIENTVEQEIVPVTVSLNEIVPENPLEVNINVKHKKKSKSIRNKIVKDQQDTEDAKTNARLKTRSFTKAEIKVQNTSSDASEQPIFNTSTENEENLSEIVKVDIVDENIVAKISSDTISSKKSKTPKHGESNNSKHSSTRKSNRLSSFSKDDYCNEKISNINSVELSENGHLIFKMHKEDDSSKIHENSSTINENVSKSKHVPLVENTVENLDSNLKQDGQQSFDSSVQNVTIKSFKQKKTKSRKRYSSGSSSEDKLLCTLVSKEPRNVSTDLNSTDDPVPKAKITDEEITDVENIAEKPKTNSRKSPKSKINKKRKNIARIESSVVSDLEKTDSLVPDQNLSQLESNNQFTDNSINEYEPVGEKITDTLPAGDQVSDNTEKDISEDVIPKVSMEEVTTHQTLVTDTININYKDETTNDNISKEPSVLVMNQKLIQDTSISDFESQINDSIPPESSSHSRLELKLNLKLRSKKKKNKTLVKNHNYSKKKASLLVDTEIPVDIDEVQDKGEAIENTTHNDVYDETALENLKSSENCKPTDSSMHNTKSYEDKSDTQENVETLDFPQAFADDKKKNKKKKSQTNKTKNNNKLLNTIKREEKKLSKLRNISEFEKSPSSAFSRKSKKSNHSEYMLFENKETDHQNSAMEESSDDPYNFVLEQTETPKLSFIGSANKYDTKKRKNNKKDDILSCKFVNKINNYDENIIDLSSTEEMKTDSYKSNAKEDISTSDEIHPFASHSETPIGTNLLTSSSDDIELISTDKSIISSKRKKGKDKVDKPISSESNLHLYLKSQNICDIDVPEVLKETNKEEQNDLPETTISKNNKKSKKKHKLSSNRINLIEPTVSIKTANEIKPRTRKKIAIPESYFDFSVSTQKTDKIPLKHLYISSVSETSDTESDFTEREKIVKDCPLTPKENISNSDVIIVDDDVDDVPSPISNFFNNDAEIVSPITVEEDPIQNENLLNPNVVEKKLDILKVKSKTKKGAKDNISVCQNKIKKSRKHRVSPIEEDKGESASQECSPSSLDKTTKNQVMDVSTAIQNTCDNDNVISIVTKADSIKNVRITSSVVNIHNSEPIVIDDETDPLLNSIREESNELDKSDHLPISKLSNVTKINLNEDSNTSTAHNQFLENFDMFSEKRPRKSTILAIKKISQTFKLDSSDTEDKSENRNRLKSRQSNKHQKKHTKKIHLELPSPNNDNSKVEESIVDITENSTTDKTLIPQEKPLIRDISMAELPHDAIILDEKFEKAKADTYCLISKKRLEDLIKHKMTLLQMSKLTEMEIQEIKSKQDKVIEPISEVRIDPDYTLKESTTIIDEQKDKDVDFSRHLIIENNSGRPYKSLAERKSFDHESAQNIPVPIEPVSVNIPNTVYKLNSEDEKSSVIQPTQEIGTAQSRKKLSCDEALFFECCSLLKESDAYRKHVREPDVNKASPKIMEKSENNKTYEKTKQGSVLTYDLSVKSVTRDVETITQHLPPPLIDEQTQFKDNFDAAVSKDLNITDICKTKYSKKDNKSIYKYEISALLNDDESKRKESSSKSKSDYQFSATQPHSSTSFNNDDSSQTYDMIKENEVDSLSSNKDFLEDPIETSPYRLESLIIRSNSNDFSDNADSVMSNKDTGLSNKSIRNKKNQSESKHKSSMESIKNAEKSPIQIKSSTYREAVKNDDCSNFKKKAHSDRIETQTKVSNEDGGLNFVDLNKSNSKTPVLPSEVIEFEDKFDKIKRKAREKAQAAQEALAAIVPVNIYPRYKKKNHTKLRKQTKSSTDSSTRDIKMSKSRRVSKKKGRFRDYHKFASKKILTKGALKEFDGIKVSIPTQEINLNILENAKPGLHELAEYALQDEIVTSDAIDDSENLTSNVKKNAESVDKNHKDKNASQMSEYRSYLPDIYEFFDDDDDDDDILSNLKMASPSNANSADKKSGSNKNKNNDNNEKTPTEVQNDDSQISSLSFSDRDDFIYMSDDYTANQSEDDTNISSNSIDVLSNTNKSNKKFKTSKNKKITKKSAIMGRIFKNNAIRNEQKPVNEEISDLAPKLSPLYTRANMDQLFDSLLEKSSASNNRSSSKGSDKYPGELSETTEYCRDDNTCIKLGTLTSGVISDFEDSEIDEKSRSPIRTNQRKIMPRLKARSSDDETVNLSSKEVSDMILNKEDSEMCLETYEDNIGVANRKSQRKCTTGKQNVLAESWSSESDYEDFRQFEEYSSVPRSHKHRRPRRSRRHRFPSDPKSDHQQTYTDRHGHDTDRHSHDIEQISSFSGKSFKAIIDDLNDKSCDDDNDDSLIEKEYKTGDDISLRKDSDVEMPKHFEDESSQMKKSRVKMKRPMFKNRRVSFNNLNNSSSNHKGQSGRRRRKQSQKPFDYDDEFKPARIAEPLTTQKRNKRAASDMLYYWSSSSDDDAPNVNIDNMNREPEPIEQHGWIVGDSHKKLVTMLAHAKGRKLDDNATVKEKKTRLQN